MITIGNIKGVRKEHQITVFRASDHSPYLQVVLSDEAVYKRELMTDHYLQTTFPYTRDIGMKSRIKEVIQYASAIVAWAVE